MRKNTFSSSFFVKLVVERRHQFSRSRTPPYGRSISCWELSGTGTGMYSSEMTSELVFSSPFQKSGTVTVCLMTDIFCGAVCPFCDDPGSWAAT